MATKQIFICDRCGEEGHLPQLFTTDVQLTLTHTTDKSPIYASGNVDLCEACRICVGNFINRMFKAREEPKQ